MIVLPTRNLPGEANGRRFLTIEAYVPAKGYAPESWFRGQSVGVGGRYTMCRIAPGEPVRAATQGELRRLDRQRIDQMLARYPDAVIRVSRSRH